MHALMHMHTHRAKTTKQTHVYPLRTVSTSYLDFSGVVVLPIGILHSGLVAVSQEALDAVFALQASEDLVHCAVLDGVLVDGKGRPAKCRQQGGVCVLFTRNNNHDYVDGRVDLNLSKSIQSAAGLKDLKPAANVRYLMCKSLPYYLHLLYRSN